jgi:outer membrane protein assembly factor BamE (lipoprotein component of BamABCDE complex)
MTKNLFIALMATLILSTGCKLIYKQNVQQGNAHEQEDLDQLELGMTKKQVAYLLGTPAIQDPFHQDRWDYISTLSRRGGDPVSRLVTLKFENGVLTETFGVGDSTGGDIKALAQTQSAVAQIDDLETAKRTELVSDDGVINWTLQLGAFSTPAQAFALTEKAREKGYQAVVEEQIVPGLGTRYQVRSGLYDTYEEALEALRRIEKELDVAGITVPVDIVSADDQE